GSDPENSTWAWSLAESRALLGQVLLEQDRPTEALPLLAAARTELARERAADPGNASMAPALAAAETDEARARAGSGSVPEARREAEEARAVMLKLARPAGAAGTDAAVTALLAEIAL